MPTSPLTPAQAIRLHRLLASLTDELAAWQDLAEGRPPVGAEDAGSAVEAKRFAPHRSQLRHLSGFFGGIVAHLQADIAAAVPPAQTADRILQAHAIWAWFRAKLLLRYSPALAPWLFAADELAWACLRPLAEARAAALDATDGAGPATGATLAALLKTPPLLYLGREVSPFVYPRDWALTSQIAGVTDPAWQALLQRAPFATISMPWYETAHLAGTLVLAHEIGHVVDLDLGLSAELDQALAAAAALPDAHRAAWQHWRVETFADLFGAATGGLGFCRALADFLQQDGRDLAAEPIDASRPYSYPPRYLRVLLVLEVLRRDGDLPAEAVALLGDWQTRHGTAHTAVELVADLPGVVAALLDQPLAALGGHSIRGLLGDVARFDQSATAAAGRLLQGIQPDAREPRALFAAATLAFAQDPAGYQARAIDARVLKLIRAVAEDKPRAALKAPDTDLAVSRAAGAGLAELLGG